MTPMPFDSPWLTGLLSAILGGVGSGLYLRRRISRDNTEIVRDRAEAGLVATLQAERDAALAEAQKVREHRTDDAQAIARLTADNEHLKRDVGRLTGDIRRMIRGLPRSVQEFLATDLAGLDSRP